MPRVRGSAVALPALGGQQETAQSCGAGLASAGPSPPRAAVARPRCACAERARQLRRSRNAAPLYARSALTSGARGSRAERAPAVGVSAKTPSALCWRPGARRMAGAA